MKCEGVLNQRGVNIISSILDTLSAFCRVNNKSYCFPSQETILSKLKDYHSTSISRRCLNSYLSYMENTNMIMRRRRISKDKKSGTTLFRSTLYWIKDNAYKSLKRLANKIKRILSFRRVQITAHYTSTTEEYIKKDCKEKGILPENRQLNLPPDDRIDIADIKAFNLKLRNDRIIEKRGR